MSICSAGEVSVAVPDADELRVTATVWQRLKEVLPHAEHAEVYQRIGPALIDDNEVLLAEQSSLLDILASYRREADGVARKRAEAGRLVRQPAQEMLRQRLQQLLTGEATSASVPEDEEGIVQYCLSADGIPPRPFSRAASGSSRHGMRTSMSTLSSGGVVSSAASTDTAPTQPSPSVCGDRQMGGVDFSGFLSEISVRSAEAQHRFATILPPLRDLLSEERSLLEEDIRWLHELLVDEMQYMARARSFTEPSAAVLAKLYNRLERSPPGTPASAQMYVSPPRRAPFAAGQVQSPAPPGHPSRGGPRTGKPSSASPNERRNRLSQARRFAAEADEVDATAEQARLLIDAAVSGSISEADLPRRGRTVAEHFDIGLEISDSE
eukprot:Hpha_TRINITY_DN12865_c0_g2::TRINITY_DN12865_c0_g2_i1::g.24114::m.24114